MYIEIRDEENGNKIFDDAKGFYGVIARPDGNTWILHGSASAIDSLHVVATLRTLADKLVADIAERTGDSVERTNLMVSLIGEFRDIQHIH